MVANGVTSLRGINDRRWMVTTAAHERYAPRLGGAVRPRRQRDGSMVTCQIRILNNPSLYIANLLVAQLQL